MPIDIEKYSVGILEHLDSDNVKKIVEFLQLNNCTYIDELLNNYLDLFTFDYEEFKTKFNILNKKYNYNLIEEVKYNMDILEEFFE